MNNHLTLLTRKHPALLGTLTLLLALLVSVSTAAEITSDNSQPTAAASEGIYQDGKISLTLRDVPIAEVMEMLSRSARVNILLSDEVQGEISVNLYDVDVDEAIHSIATSGGYGVERRKGSYFIVMREEVGKNDPGGPTELRTYKVQYSDTDAVSDIVENYLSSYGQITTLPDRNLLVVQDTPYFLDRIDKLLIELDREPRQILIKAQILEVGLKDSESYGLDWRKLFNSSSRIFEACRTGV